jgi:glycosyltransferase involved in cell wall biosynthesis
MRRSSGFEPILLSRTGPPHAGPDPIHRGTLVSAVDGDPNQYLFYTDIADFDWLTLTSRRKETITRFFKEFLEAYQPDVVHFQHTLFFGFDVLQQTRNTLPRTPIVYTLHEYGPICHRDGQMLRTGTDEPCLEASPRRCHTCFPDISPQSFFLRKRFIASHMARVDLFVAPSRFLLERYAAWGIPREKLRYEDYGRAPATRAADRSGDRPAGRPRDRLGFFGQLNHYKGISVLLEAMRILAGDERSGPPPRAARIPPPSRGGHGAAPHLWVHGANLHFAPPVFQDRFHRLLEATRSNVTFAGRYEPGRQPQLMADIDWVVVPSIWWENSPLVIQEAFEYGKPVICSDMGGMAEKVSHGVNGLHFRANDPVNLADTIRLATGSPGLWDRLANGIRVEHGMDEHVDRIECLYRELLAR